MRNASNVTTVKLHWLIDHLLLRTIISTAQIAMITTLRLAVTTADMSSEQVSYCTGCKHFYVSPCHVDIRFYFANYLYLHLFGTIAHTKNYGSRFFWEAVKNLAEMAVVAEWPVKQMKNRRSWKCDVIVGRC